MGQEGSRSAPEYLEYRSPVVQASDAVAPGVFTRLWTWYKSAPNGTFLGIFSLCFALWGTYGLIVALSSSWLEQAVAGAMMYMSDTLAVPMALGTLLAPRVNKFIPLAALGLVALHALLIWIFPPIG